MTRSTTTTVRPSVGNRLAISVADAAAKVAAAQVASDAQVAADTAAAKVASDAAVAQVAASNRQRASDAGKSLADVLCDETARKTLQSAVGNVKRSDLNTAASDPTGRTYERLERADLKSLVARLQRAQVALETMLSIPERDLRGANVGTRIGCVSCVALCAAVADANSKSDALAQFASA